MRPFAISLKTSFNNGPSRIGFRQSVMQSNGRAEVEVKNYQRVIRYNATSEGSLNTDSFLFIYSLFNFGCLQYSRKYYNNIN